MPHILLRTTVLLGTLLSSAGLALASQREIPKPLPEHPGNIFLAGEEVSVRLPGDRQGAFGAWWITMVGLWPMVAAPGRSVWAGWPSDTMNFVERAAMQQNRRPPPSPCLHFQAPTPTSSPIDCDVAMGTLPKQEIAAMANFCALAGVNWTRERFSWSALEKTPGRFERECLYDAAIDILTAAGLKVLQVSHSSPPWAAAADRGRFPVDLRDAYRFYREAARRWRGKVAAIEPWNEADAWDFGNHTGGEIATMQKASYLGLKAGNPQVIVCQNAFCSNRSPGTIDDFRANRAWPYFDTFNHHNYEPYFHYDEHYAAFRTISAGRPMWLTECGLTVPWSGDALAKEPNGPDLRVQTGIVVKTFVHSIFEGSAATFYFILRNYGEGHKQFGLLHNDLTPRPGYLALAAVGRLLSDARPLGRINTANPNLYAFVFRAKPDGKPRDVLVAWIDDKPEFPSQATAPLGQPEKLNLGAAPIAVYDNIGRQRSGGDATLEITIWPKFAVLPEGAAARLDLAPPPAPSPWLEGKPSPVVLQAVLPKSRVLLKPSAYRVVRGTSDRIPVCVYNFSEKKARGRLAVRGPRGWNIKLPESVEAAPGQRVSLELTLDVPASATGLHDIAIDGDFGPLGKPVVSFRLEPQSP